MNTCYDLTDTLCIIILINVALVFIVNGINRWLDRKALQHWQELCKVADNETE